MRLKLIQRVAKVVLIWVVIFLLSIDSAMACRWLGQWQARRCCLWTMDSCCRPIQVTCCEESRPVCDSEEKSRSIPSQSDIPETAPPQLEVDPESNSETTEEKPQSEQSETDIPTESTPSVETADEPKAEEPQPKAPELPTEEPQEPATEEAEIDLSDILNNTEPTEEEPAQQENGPGVEDPANNTDEDPKLIDPIPAIEEPKTTPAPELNPTESKNELDKIFGDIPVSPSPTVLPETPTENNTAEEENSLDSLFNNLPTPDGTPAVDPVQDPMPVDGDPFSKPKPEEGEEDAKTELDNLFGKIPGDWRESSKPTLLKQSKSPVNSSVEVRHAISNQHSKFVKLQDPVRLPDRQWTDNTGTFQVRGRLVEILEGKVRLLKENGRTTTVPMRRLSLADRDYVRNQAKQYGQGPLNKFAVR